MLYVKIFSDQGVEYNFLDNEEEFSRVKRNIRRSYMDNIKFLQLTSGFILNLHFLIGISNTNIDVKLPVF